MALITMKTIRENKIQRSKNTLMAHGFPEPEVRGNPNLYDEGKVDRWILEFVARARANEDDAPAQRAAKARAAKRKQSPTERAT